MTLMNTYTNLTNIIEELKANGVTPKVTKLNGKKPRKADLYCDRVKGGSTRVRCNGGSRGTVKATKHSALEDVR